MEDFTPMSTADRWFVISPLPGTKPKAGNSMVDPRLLDSKNRLRAFQDSATCLWYLKYDNGALPEPLRDKSFTKFTTLQETVQNYFNKKGYEATLNVDA